jgi:hypothetical protein
MQMFRGIQLESPEWGNADAGYSKALEQYLADTPSRSEFLLTHHKLMLGSDSSKRKSVCISDEDNSADPLWPRNGTASMTRVLG